MQMQQNDDFCLTTRMLRTRLQVQHGKETNKPEARVAVPFGTSQGQQVGTKKEIVIFQRDGLVSGFYPFKIGCRAANF
jgi:hypothetical protein